MIVIAQLFFLAVVDTARVMLADPLAPAVKNDLFVTGHFPPLLGGIADEEVVDAISHTGQGMGQVRDPRTESPGHGVNIRPFKGKNNEDRVVRSNSHRLLLIELRIRFFRPNPISSIIVMT